MERWESSEGAARKYAEVEAIRADVTADRQVRITITRGPSFHEDISLPVQIARNFAQAILDAANEAARPPAQRSSE